MKVDIVRRAEPLAELYPRGIEQIAMGTRGKRGRAYVDAPEGSIAYMEMSAEAFGRVHHLFNVAKTYRTRQLRLADYERCPVVAYRSGALALGAGEADGSELTAQMTMEVHHHHGVKYVQTPKGEMPVAHEEPRVDTFGVELRETLPGKTPKITRHTAREFGGWWYDQRGYETYLDRGWERALPIVHVGELASMVTLLDALTVVENKLYSLEPGGVEQVRLPADAVA